MPKPRILVVEDDHPALLTVLPSVPALIGGHLMVGESPSIREIKSSISKVAATACNVLVTGETGTGKEGDNDEMIDNAGDRVKVFYRQ